MTTSARKELNKKILNIILTVMKIRNIIGLIFIWQYKQ